MCADFYMHVVILTIKSEIKMTFEADFFSYPYMLFSPVSCHFIHRPISCKAEKYGEMLYLIQWCQITLVLTKPDLRL